MAMKLGGQRLTLKKLAMAVLVVGVANAIGSYLDQRAAGGRLSAMGLFPRRG